MVPACCILPRLCSLLVVGAFSEVYVLYLQQYCGAQEARGEIVDCGMVVNVPKYCMGWG